MFENYLKLAWRNLVKNKASSVINISGLAVGLATSIIIMLVVVDEFSYDQFLPGLPNIYMVMKNQIEAGRTSTGRSTPGPLAAAMRKEMPGLNYVARATNPEAQLTRAGEKNVDIRGMYAEPDYFSIMHFTVVQGDPVAALRDPGSVVITEGAAKKLFGDGKAIGKMIYHNNLHALKISAVIKDIPAASSNQFDMVLPFSIFEKENTWLSKWDDNRILTWMQLNSSVNLAAFNQKLTRLIQQHADDKAIDLFAYPFADLRLHANFSNGKPEGGRIDTVLLLAITGLFILLIACINFMNLVTARSEHRSREVGVRKVLGASRKLIIIQFFGEALFLTFVSLLIGILVACLTLPAFNQFTGKVLVFNYWNWRILLSLFGIGLFTALAAGSYPAFFLSRFHMIGVLKGATASGRGGSLLRRILVTIQFIISIFFIIGTIVIYRQIDYLKNRPLGYDQDNLIDITARGDMSEKFAILKNNLSEIPGVKNVSAGSDDIIDFRGGITGLDWPGKRPGDDFTVTATWVHYDWVKTMGLHIIAGRDFDPAFGSDSAACLINQSAVAQMGLKEPVLGKRLGGNMIIGILQNFVFSNPSGSVAPMAVYLRKANLNHFFVRFQDNGHWRQTLAAIERTVKKINPGYPFEFSFTKENYQKRFDEASSFGLLATLFGSMAIFISCLGLFSLSAFLAERRSKEMSIRKVLGASARSIWLALSKDLLSPVFIAIIVVIPISVWVFHSVISKLTYHSPLSWWIFTLAATLAIFVAVATISYQGIKTAFANPVKSLRTE